MRHLLDEDDVGFPRCDSRSEGAVVAGPIARDHTERLAIEVGLRGPFFGSGLTKADEGGHFVSKDEDGDEPNGGGKEREGGAEEKV